MGVLESQDEDAPKRVLWYKPMVFWGLIRPHHRDEVWSASLCQTFLTTCVGSVTLGLWLQLFFAYDVLDYHVTTCTTHSGSKKTHDWEV